MPLPVKVDDESAWFKSGLYTALKLSERREFRSPGHLVSGANWIPGTASTPVSLSHQSDEA